MLFWHSCRVQSGPNLSYPVSRMYIRFRCRFLYYLQLSPKLLEMRTSMFTAQLTALLHCVRLTAATLYNYSRKYRKMVWVSSLLERPVCHAILGLWEQKFLRPFAPPPPRPKFWFHQDLWSHFCDKACRRPVSTLCVDLRPLTHLMHTLYIQQIQLEGYKTSSPSPQKHVHVLNGNCGM
jgi:hypothetical protein